jgi:hypothetical protein
MSKKKEESKELAIVTSDYAVSSDLMGELAGMGLGAGEEIDTKDILIPKLMLTQGLTKAVAKGKARVGRYVNSVDLTDHGDSLEAIVIQSYKVWQEYKIVEGDKDEYIQTLDFYGNEDLAYQFTDEKGNSCKRKEVLGFYCILLDEIKSGAAFPYIIDFKGGSKGAGRQLSTHFAKLRSANLPSFAKVFTFGTELIEAKHTYYVKTVDMGRNIEREELNAVKGWLAELSKNKDKYRVDDSEEQENIDGIVEAEVVNETSNGKKF